MLVDKIAWLNEPFRVSPSPSDAYTNPSLDAVLAMLAAAIHARAGLSLLCGDEGAGKTTLLRRLQCRLNPHPNVLVSLEQASPETILREIRRSTGATIAPVTDGDLLGAALGKVDHVPLLVDDGEKLTEEALAFVRELAEAARDGRQLFPLVIASRPEGEARIVASMRGTPVQRMNVPLLAPAEVGGFIAHQMGRAMVADEAFEEAAIQLIARHSGGVPKRIGALSAKALTLAALDGRRVVAKEHVEPAIPPGSSEGLHRDPVAAPAAAPSPGGKAPEQDALDRGQPDLPAPPAGRAGDAGAAAGPTIRPRAITRKGVAYATIPAAATIVLGLSLSPPSRWDEDTVASAGSYPPSEVAEAGETVKPPARVAGPAVSSGGDLDRAPVVGGSSETPRGGEPEIIGAKVERKPEPAIIPASAPAAAEIVRKVDVAAERPPAEPPGPDQVRTGAAMVDPAKAAAKSPAEPVPAAQQAVATGLPKEPTGGARVGADALMELGDRLLRTGDIAAARLFYLRAAEQGDGRGATATARTYDPAALRELGARGLDGDVKTALVWYRRAAALGDPAAPPRLRLLQEAPAR